VPAPNPAIAASPTAHNTGPAADSAEVAVDVILLGFIAGYTFGGFRTGLVHRLVGLLFFALSFVLGAYLRAPIGGLIHAAFSNIPESYGEMVGYIFIFPVLIAGAHIVAYPFLKGRRIGGVTEDANRILGAVFGFIEAILIISAVIVIFDTYLGSKPALPAGTGLGFLSSIRDSFDESTTVQLLRGATVPLVLGILGPLLPSDVSSVVPIQIPGLPPGVGIPGLPTGLPFPSPTHTPRPT
jgi:uncharacterized membrane protein required for colicin V production